MAFWAHAHSASDGRRRATIAGDWKYDVVSIGYPGPVVRGRPAWNRIIWARAGWGSITLPPSSTLSKWSTTLPCRRWGATKGAQCCFSGLGTGLGSALIYDGVLEPLEFAHLPYKKGRSYEDYLGIRGLKRLGKKKWRRAVADVVAKLLAAFEVDYVVLGGGNSKKLKKYPRAPGWARTPTLSSADSACGKKPEIDHQ